LDLAIVLNLWMERHLPELPRTRYADEAVRHGKPATGSWNSGDGLMSSKAGDDPFAGLSERKRVELALTNIFGAKSRGRFVSIEAEVRKAGYQSEADFWHAALARPMIAVEFAEFLKDFHLSRPSFDERAFDLAINSALTLGLRMNPPFVVCDETAPRRHLYDIETAYVQPRAAALWLLSMPSERWLVPEELRAFLEDGLKPPAAAKHGGGAPEQYDWWAVRKALEDGCRHFGGVPSRNHPDSEWRTQAHACRYVEKRMEKEWANGGPGDSTLKSRVSSMLRQIASESADN
jgi:hypothetical protein